MISRHIYVNLKLDRKSHNTFWMDEAKTVMVICVVLNVFGSCSFLSLAHFHQWKSVGMQSIHRTQFNFIEFNMQWLIRAMQSTHKCMYMPCNHSFSSVALFCHRNYSHMFHSNQRFAQTNAQIWLLLILSFNKILIALRKSEWTLETRIEANEEKNGSRRHKLWMVLFDRSFQMCWVLIFLCLSFLSSISLSWRKQHSKREIALQTFELCRHSRMPKN